MDDKQSDRELRPILSDDTADSDTYQWAYNCPTIVHFTYILRYFGTIDNAFKHIPLTVIRVASCCVLEEVFVFHIEEKKKKAGGWT